ncbi:MAG: hypothetical protein EOP04_01530 [Proteobacteria bacterium]|nr:MAG: hypothetical protein EOP04_01530 [Pseudomonadota bacterium]
MENAGTKKRGIAFTLGFLGLLFFAPALTVYFGVDDFYLISSGIKGISLPNSFSELYLTRYFSEHLTFQILAPLFGNKYWAYHIVALVSHLFTAILFYKIMLQQRICSPENATIASLLFFLQPGSFTVISWATLGLNEPPVAFLTLLGVASVYGFVFRNKWWLGILSVLIVILAAGFKNQAIYIPIFYFTFVLLKVIKQKRLALNQTKEFIPFIILNVFMGAFCLWYFSQIVPNTSFAKNPAYSLVWDWQVLASGYLSLLFAAINPFAYFREALGYQTFVPFALTMINPLLMTIFKLMAVLTILLASLYLASRRKEAITWLVLFSLALVSMSFAAAMPNHRYEYYSYLSMIPLSINLSYLYLPIYRKFSSKLPLAVGLIALICIINGQVFYRSNIFISQAENARKIQKLSMELPVGAEIHFIDPDQRAVADIDSGNSLKAFSPEKEIKVSFESRSGFPFRKTLWPSQVLAYLDPRSEVGGGLLVIDEYRGAREVPIDLFNNTIRHKFSVSERNHKGIAVRVGTYSRANSCTLILRIIDSTGRALPNLEDWIKCAKIIDNSFVYLDFDQMKLEANGSYILEIKLIASDPKNSIALWSHRVLEPNLLIAGKNSEFESKDLELSHFLVDRIIY